MKKEIKHTSLPWELQQADDNWRASINQADDSSFSGVVTFIENTSDNEYDPQLRIDAEFIVRAVNTHYYLLEAAKAMLAAFDLPDILTDNLADTSAIKKTRLAIIKAEAI